MPWDRAVNSSGCVSFDGTDDLISFGTPSALDLPGEVSLSLWVYTNTVAAQGYGAILFSSADVSSLQQWSTAINRTAGCVSFLWGNAVVLTSNPVIKAGVWTHVCFVRSGSSGNWTAKIYINGRLDSTATTTTNPSAQQACWAGHIAGSAAAKLNGRLDELRAYNRELTEAEIQSIHRNSSAPPTLGLVCYFPLNEGTGTTVTDSVGSLTGTLTNGPTWQTQVAPRLRPDRDVAPRAKAYSLSFDGSDDYVSIGNPSAYAVGSSGTFTLTAWVKTSSTAADLSVVCIGTLGGPRMTIFANSGTGGAGVGSIEGDFRTDAATRIEAFTSSSFGFNSGTWRHVGLTRESDGKARLYVDGVLAATSSGGSTGAITPTDARIGHFSGYVAGFMSGTVKDVRFYNSALSAANIRTLVIGGDVSGTVGKWELNEGTGTTATDTGSGGNNGTLTNGPTWSTDVPQWWRQDKHTWGLSCDGSNDIVIVPSITVGTEFTYSVWVKNRGAFVQFGAFLSTYDGAGGCLLDFGTTDGSLRWRGVFSSGFTVDVANVIPTAWANDSFWHHIAGTCDGVTARLYFDGRQIGSATVSGITSLNKNVTIGGRHDGAGSYSKFVNALLRDSRIYNSALQASDIVKLANNVPITTMPVGHWPLDEGAGTTAIDKSGTGNNGTLTNGPVYTGDIPQWFRKTIESTHALNCDGSNDYVQLPAISQVNNASKLTVAGWVNRTAGTYSIPFSNSKAAGDLNNRTHLSWWTDNNIYANVSNGGSSFASFASTATGWHHVAMVFDGTQSTNATRLKVFLNGAQLTTGFLGTIPATTFNNTLNNPHIGRLETFYSVGALDEIVVSDRVFSAAEIADMAAGYIVPAGVLGRWKLDNNANDSIGSNHGTEQGGVSYSSAVPATIAKRPRRAWLPFA